MDKPITQTEVDRLRAPFPLESHSIREGNKTSTGKIQWFTYVDKPEVETRLNEVFPGEWSSSQPVLYPMGNAMAATIAITIRGITRGNTGEDSNGQEKAKGATTDAFRRAAADWGVAKYLWEMDLKIYTEGYEKGDYKARDMREKEAFGKFADWFKKKFQNVTPLNGQQRTPQEALRGNGPTERNLTAAISQNAANANVGASEGNSEGASQFIYNRVELFTEAAKVKALADVNSSERNNTIIKMEGEGAFTNARDYQQCIELVIARINSPEHGKAKKVVGA